MENIEQRLQNIESRLRMQEQMHDHVSFTDDGGLHGKRNVVYKAIATWIAIGFVIGAGIVLTVQSMKKK